MDRFASWVRGVDDGDLVLLPDQGMAYQKDQGHLVAYDERYFDKCASYEGQEICAKINSGRVALVSRHYGRGPMVDIGVGSGEFIRRRPMTHGIDVNVKAQEWLFTEGLWADNLANYRAFSFWDVIEHVPDISEYFSKIAVGAYLFTSLPIFSDLGRIRESKHYRPDEHLYYWTESGFVGWMGLYGFELLERTDFESKAGRESILSFAFRRVTG